MLNVKHSYKDPVFYMHEAQLGLRMMFTAVWAQPPSVSERFVARRVRFERLSLPLGSNFLIITPPERALVLVLQRENNNYCRKDKGGVRNSAVSFNTVQLEIKNRIKVIIDQYSVLLVKCIKLYYCQLNYVLLFFSFYKFEGL